ncbi:hypothetical protein PBI_AN9_88 [Mycobacterium phage AN9]|nr:hypothetical protein PBI_VC3_87 [Mycobacterium phage VC3]QJD52550.1 hypothetical protein PBI_ANI8_88 [Mycobacterium phage ANI8]QJD52642.1 hypothetical protein PBI_AN9_88 [Mycobacterium phage AN9]BBC43642.1 hypothetical protein [Mycobacterium phage C3]
MTIVNMVSVPAVELKLGDFFVRQNFVRKVTGLQYLPVSQEVSISADYATEFGKSSDVVKVSAHEHIKILTVEED